MIDLRQTSEYANYLRKIGWLVKRKDCINYFVRKFPLIGSFIKIQRPEKIDIQFIEQLAKNYFQIAIEPNLAEQSSLLEKHGFKASKSSYLPTKTLQVDLTKDKNELFNQLKKDAKSSLNKTKDLKIYEIEKVDKFRESWKEAVGFRRHVPSKDELQTIIEVFKEKNLFLVTPDGSAGAIFLKVDDKAYYWQAFTNKKARKELAQYKILWSGILWAKNRGAKILDFEGIYDKRFPNKSWLGFTHFKKSFGGVEIEYPGAFVKLSFNIL